jgi:hypothetical protein
MLCALKPSTQADFVNLLHEKPFIRIGEGDNAIDVPIPVTETKMPARAPYRVLVCGRPGTGKTYAITKWIAQAQAANRNVLFNAEFNVTSAMWGDSSDNGKQFRIRANWDTAMRLFGADIMYAATNVPIYQVIAYGRGLFDEIWHAKAIGDWTQLIGDRGHEVPKDETKAAVARRAAAAAPAPAAGSGAKRPSGGVDGEEPAAKKRRAEFVPPPPRSPKPTKSKAAAAAAESAEASELSGGLLEMIEKEISDTDEDGGSDSD